MHGIPVYKLYKCVGSVSWPIEGQLVYVIFLAIRFDGSGLVSRTSDCMS